MQIEAMFVNLDQAIYFAPRGRRRLLHLGGVIAQRYLSPDDRLVGVVGDAGAGKSLLLRGMFPGLVLTNDDDGINIRPLPVLNDAENGFFGTHTYHMDVRFEMAFAQIWELADAVLKAVNEGCRVVIEHFDLLYPVLEFNAEILIGVGDEVIVTRPSLFGPEPKEIADQVFNSVIYRRMAHSAEDLTAIVMMDKLGLEAPKIHSDVRRGFVLEFKEKPDMDLHKLEALVLDLIERNVNISYCDDKHILIGDDRFYCSGPRLHMRSTGEIKNFRLIKEIKFSPLTETYLLAGLVGT